VPATAWTDCPPLARRQANAKFDIDGVRVIYAPIEDTS
jgi:hypothetical protein